MQGAASIRTGAYWFVREDRKRSGNAADGRSWTGSYLRARRLGDSAAAMKNSAVASRTIVAPDGRSNR